MGEDERDLDGAEMQPKVDLVRCETDSGLGIHMATSTDGASATSGLLLSPVLPTNASPSVRGSSTSKGEVKSVLEGLEGLEGSPALQGEVCIFPRISVSLSFSLSLFFRALSSLLPCSPPCSRQMRARARVELLCRRER